MTLRSILGISSDAYAKRSKFFLNKLINSAFIASSSPRLMNVNFSAIVPYGLFEAHH